MTAMTVHTWADGFGVWHAEVPAGVNAAHVARKAIERELDERGQRGQGFAVRVQCISYDGDARRIVYREAD